MAPESATVQLTPSDVVVLRGEAFAPPSTLGDAHEILRSGQKVRASRLAVEAYAAAFLAAESAGALAFSRAQRSRLFGLRKVEVLVASTTGAPSPFPPESLEGRLVGLAARDGTDVERVVYAALGEDVPRPFAWAIARVEQGLARRGVLAVEEHRVLKVLKTRRFALPEASRGLVERAGDGAAERAALDRARRERPDAWALLQASIERGIRSRQKESEGADLG
jgi:hypothetical protein